MHPIFVEIRRQLTLGETARDSWTAEQWWESFVYTFYYGPKHGFRTEADDLLFLVMHERFQRPKDPPYTVIRLLEELPTEFHKEGTQFEKIDWKRSLELNLVMQTTFELTVAICNADEVPLIGKGIAFQCPSSQMVTKPVQASTVTVGLDQRQLKAETPTVCYPNISFGVEDFNDLFSSMVLADELQRYCVVLKPTESLAKEESRNQLAAPVFFKAEEDCAPSRPEAPIEGEPISVSTSQSALKGHSKNRIFGGIVTFDQVKIGLLGRSHCVPKSVLQERAVRMKGPDGNGLAEVLTSIDAETSSIHSGNDEPEQSDSSTRKRLNLFRNGVQSARDLFFRRESEGRMLSLTEDTRLRFRCSLMTLTLPVTLVALKILES